MSSRQQIARQAWVAALFLAGFAAPALADPCHADLPTKPGTVFGGTVTHIIDGDGICVGSYRGGIEVRLGDFNAPELNQPGGREAKAAMSALVLGKHVDCVSCLGARGRCKSWDRVIATCSINGRTLGDLMRERGIAEGGR